MKERMQQSTCKLLLLLQHSWWRHLSRTPPAQAENITAIMEEKMAAMKNDIMWGIRVKMDESSKVKDNLNFHFGPC
jgi:hypothetical protein